MLKKWAYVGTFSLLNLHCGGIVIDNMIDSFLYLVILNIRSAKNFYNFFYLLISFYLNESQLAIA